MVNARINQRLGVRSRVGADLDVIRRAIEVAGTWLAELTSEHASRQETASNDMASPRVSAPPRAGSAAEGRDTSRSRRQGAPGLRATGEQEAAVEAFLSRQHLALQAGAGTGKTTTLTLLAEAD